VDYFHITMNNIRGSRIHGQLARPTATDRKLPAMVIFQWAGIYPLRPPTVTGPAADGWLALNIISHDLPIDQPRTFYAEHEAGPLKDYPSIGNDDRETTYFLRMYLSCYRAVEYLSGRDDWDGKTLVVMGVSQGGQQALMVAALHPKVTACMAAVPAGCDMTGADIGREPGWPQWYRQTQGGKDPARVRQASRYYDVVNFAPRITCPVLVGIGLIDEACPPAGVLAAMNRVKADKQVILLPRGDHGNSRNSHAAYYARQREWIAALREGRPLSAPAPADGR
jgi:cephalosporin-C deacetylase-like acetyl esterase